jgi:hypothetical protein
MGWDELVSMTVKMVPIGNESPIEGGEFQNATVESDASCGDSVVPVRLQVKLTIVFPRAIKGQSTA